ncbi:hypothetical protein [Embleya scabrispora]|uniref:hypothetical protein n=1 Tax=Embleya scabrispora TaxID=159449 RepID=UPI000382C67C|nr:hypothetical protein [Embleya scabrispora]MYS83762.1 hypothetical protein [Streptomyces sp. SID5474]
MWTWLVVGVLAYLAFLACVIVVLRAAKARARVERAADVQAVGVPVPTPAGESTEVIAPVSRGDRPAAEPVVEGDEARAHPLPDEHAGPVRECDGEQSGPPAPPASRSRG